jgi:hypothetical protein
MDLINSLLNPFLIYSPKVFFAGAMLLAAVFYFISLKNAGVPKPHFKILAWCIVGFQFFYALVLTLGQYYIWNGDKFGKLLLAQPGGYFLFYSWERFWLNPVLSVIIALVFWLFLNALRRKEGRFFRSGETELGLVLMLAVGWPNSVIFIPLAFLSVVFVSLFRMIFLKEPYTTVGWPFILVAALTLFFGRIILSALGLLAVLD